MRKKAGPSWRIKMLSRPRFYTPKVIPTKVERIVDPPVPIGPDGQPEPVQVKWRIPPRVLVAALPYERVLKITAEEFSNVLSPRHFNAIQETLALSQNSMYQQLVKRPMCTGVQVEMPPPRQMDEGDWLLHKQRINHLSRPRKNWDKIYEDNQLPRAKKPLDDLMPRILQLSALQQWKVELLKEVPKDITKVSSKALLYKPSVRVEELAKPKKFEDCSVEGTLRTAIWERFEKKLENVLLKRRALAKLNYKRV